MRLQDKKLRDWQIKNLPLYLKRFEEKQVEVTCAYQGSGKTLYAAACYAISVIKSSGIVDFPLSKIRQEHLNSPNKHKNFVIIFVPSHSIVDSTIRDWSEFGVNLKQLKNREMRATSPDKLMEKGINGLILTYAQVWNYGYKTTGEWEDNHFVKFLKRSIGIDYHGVLDEAHQLTMTVEKMFEKSEIVDLNLSSRYFLGNSHLFKKIHLMSGTLIKKKYDTDTGQILKQIPFLSYTKDGYLLPDTLYGQEDAIKDGVIVKTKIIIHKIEKAEISINRQVHHLSNEDLVWYGENAGLKAYQPDYKRLERIGDAFKALYGRMEIWHPLIKYGNHWLCETQKTYKSAMGIVFCPSIEVAIFVHKNLLRNNSVLCVSPKKEKLNGCNFVRSKDISKYLSTKPSNIEWIVSCEALYQGFDLPDCKVSVLLPRIEYLSQTKISQGLGRINRIIPHYRELEAVCVTLEYKPVLDLIRISKNQHYGLIAPDTYQSEIIESHNQETILRAIDRAKVSCGMKEPVEPDKIFIQDFLLSVKAILMEDSRTSEIDYGHKNQIEDAEINIKTNWLNWADIIFKNNDANIPPERLPPSNVPGCYVIVNCKTQECLYVGHGKNLYKRVSKTNRMEAQWVRIEGWNNVYMKWMTVENSEDYEKQLISELNPKYNIR